jgi:membrane fusion protein, multidrug efflux system
MRPLIKVLLPLVVLAAAVLIAAVLIASRPEVATRAPETVAPLVRYETVTPGRMQAHVRSQGTVTPRTQTVLVAEVAGRVIEISPSMVAGGFFESRDVLLRIDPRDYELAVISARAQIAQAEARLRIEQEEAAVARREWDTLGQSGEPSPLVLREPQLTEARATLDAARAALERAERDLERTTIRAPFAGRVRDRQVDAGQVVAPGNTLATLFAVDVAEIRLPVPDRELLFLDLPPGFRVGASGPPVTIHAQFAGQSLQWQGHIVRTEGEIDPQSRMVYLVAEVRDPYGREQDETTVPLASGMFVHADIQGRMLEDVFVLPRNVMRDENQVLIIDDENRLRFRQVQVLRTDRNEVVISGGLRPGERICISPLDVVVDGMLVRTESDGDASS